MLTQMAIALSVLVANGAADGIVARNGIHAVAPDPPAKADPARAAEEAVRDAVKQFEELERSFSKQRIKERQDLEEKRQRLRWLKREDEAKQQREFAEIQKTEDGIQSIKNSLKLIVPGDQADKRIAALLERKERLQGEADERAKQIIAALREVVVVEENLRLLERQQEFSRQRARQHLDGLQKRTKHVP